jgi:hypothetical protein
MACAYLKASLTRRVHLGVYIYVLLLRVYGPRFPSRCFVSVVI